MGTAAVQTSSPPALNEAVLVEIVELAMHASTAEWLFFRELRVGTGRRNGGAQRLDAFALNTLPHTAMKRVCYEVKTSRADFLSYLADRWSCEGKRAGASKSLKLANLNFPRGAIRQNRQKSSRNPNCIARGLLTCVGEIVPKALDVMLV